MTREELLAGLSEEQIERARACKSQEELLALAKEEGIELSNEQLEAISGGCIQEEEYKGFICPNCGSTDTYGIYSQYMHNSNGGYHCRCRTCSCAFDE